MNTNVYDELIQHLESNNKSISDISAIKVCLATSYNEISTVLFDIENVSNEYDEFNKSLVKSKDYLYDSGYGIQELYGYVWYNDGTWSERYEYDGSESWSYKSAPNKNIDIEELVW